MESIFLTVANVEMDFRDHVGKPARSLYHLTSYLKDLEVKSPAFFLVVVTFILQVEKVALDGFDVNIYAISGLHIFEGLASPTMF